MASSSARKPLDDGKGKKPQKKKSKRKLDYDGGSQGELNNSPGTSSGQSTLRSFFAKAKPPSYVSCPVCSTEVDVGFINQHLDRSCVAHGGDNDLSSPSSQEKGTPSTRKIGDPSGCGRRRASLKEGASNNRKRERLSRKNKSLEKKETCEPADDTSTRKTKDPSGCGRRKASLKEGASNNRKRERLSRKYKSLEKKETCEPADNVTTISSSESLQEDSQDGMLDSRSWVTNKEDCCFEPVISSGDAYNGMIQGESSHSGWIETEGVGTPPCSSSSQNCDRTDRCGSSKTDDPLLHSSSEVGTNLKRLKRFRKRTGKVKRVELQADVEEQAETSENDLTSTGSAGTRGRSSITPQKRPVSELEDPSSKQVLVSVNKKMKLSRRARLSTKKKTVPKEQSDDQMMLNEEGNTSRPIPTEDEAHLGEVKFSERAPKISSCDGVICDGVVESTSTTPQCSQDDQEAPVIPLEVSTPPYSQRSQTGSSPTSSPHKAKEPYFVSNFKFILNSVLGNADDVSLLDDDDLRTIRLFNELSFEGQQLYVRIFQRKLAWIRVSRLDYPKIAEDLAPYAEEICGSGLFLNESHMVDLEEVLRHLPAPEMKLLTKDLKVSCPDGTQKADLVTACMNHCKKQRGLFGSSLRPLMLKRAKQRLGQCIKLCQQHRAVFTRICLLFSPVLMTEDEEKASGGQNQLQALLLVNFGRVTYPQYTINRTSKVFRDRDDLIRYEEALQYEHDIMAAMSTNDFDLASDLRRKARAAQQEVFKDSSMKECASTLPVFLQYFTALSVYEHIQYLGVEVLQKQRRYSEAVDELKLCLSSCQFRKDSRGSRWDRLALNLDQHLKDPSQALDVILSGLADRHVKTGHRLSLEQRAEKILGATRNKNLAEKRRHEFNMSPLKAENLPTITIKGKILPYTGPGVKNVFVRPASSHGAEEGIELCSVEQVAIDYYLQNGYTHGKHGEGSTFTTLIFLLFWEEIFLDIPDVFSYPYQTGPLDLRTDQFFANREEVLTKRLDQLRVADEGAITSRLQEAWLEHEGEACGGVNWDLMTLEEAKSLLGCMGGRFISAVAERLLRSHRHCRGGMPDLILWNNHTKKFKMSEVKGPGDRLSHKQILWIHFFQSIDSDVEVCHVQGIQSKSLKHRQLPASKSGPSPRKTPRGTPKKSPSKSSRRKTPAKLRQKRT